MKKSLKIIASVSIILFGVLWGLSWFEILTDYNSIAIRNILVVIYLVSSLKYFQIEVKDKDAEIKILKEAVVKANK